MSKKTGFITKQSENIDSEYDIYPEIVLSERFRVIKSLIKRDLCIYNSKYKIERPSKEPERMLII